MNVATLLFKAFLGAVLLAPLAACAWFPTDREPPYVLTATWGGKGSAPGRFDEPTGIAVAGSEVFVADARNARIQVFDLDGRFLRQFGNRGDEPERLGRPMNLAVAGNELYVADYWNDRIMIYSLDGVFLRSVGEKGSGGGQFNAPGGVAVADNGDIYVADFYNHRVQRLDADGHFKYQWGETGDPGWRGGRFSYPTDVVVAADGTIFVADGYNDRVQVFAPDGRLLRKWGGPFALNIHGPFKGWFATVTAIALGPAGEVFVADFYNDRIQKFTSRGDFLTAFGSAPEGPSHSVMGVAVAADGSVFVTNIDAHRVERWRVGGQRVKGR